MPQKRNKRKPRAEQGGSSGASTNMQWVVLALLFGLAFGGVIGYFVGSVVSAGDDAAVTDQYGRSPGHAHYNHNHP